jgi:hypothetical protein
LDIDAGPPTPSVGGPSGGEVNDAAATGAASLGSPHEGQNFWWFMLQRKQEVHVHVVVSFGANGMGSRIIFLTPHVGQKFWFDVLVLKQEGQSHTLAIVSTGVKPGGGKSMTASEEE